MLNGNIFQDESKQAIISRIEKVDGSSTRRWGKMTVAQMLTHCSMQLRLALGEVDGQTQGSFLMRTALGKWIAFSSIPWPKGSATPNEMNMETNGVDPFEIQAGKDSLLSYLDKVSRKVDLFPHPFFGRLSRKEWGRLIYKHINHHLEQFGH